MVMQNVGRTKRFFYRVGAFLGCMIVLAGLAGAYWMLNNYAENPVFALACGCFCTMVGTYIATLMLSKIHNKELTELFLLRKEFDDEQNKHQQELAQLREKISSKNNRIHQLKEKVESMEGVPILKIQQLERVFKVIFGEMKLELIDFYRIPMAPKKKVFGSNQRTLQSAVKYTGKMHFGTDLDQLRIEEKDEDTYLISGELCNFQIAEDFYGKKLMREVVVNDTKISKDAEDLQAAEEMDRSKEEEFRKKAKHGVMIDSMKQNMRNIAQNYLKLILSPLGKNLVFQDTPSPTGSSINDFIEDLRENWNNRDLGTQNRPKGIESQSKVLTIQGE